MDDCPFCAILDGLAPGVVVSRWPDAIALVPLRPRTDGHVLIVPRQHIAYPDQDPILTGITAQRAAEYARGRAHPDYNLIISAGDHATQTVMHLHFHYVPRREGDGLALPWTKP